MTQIFFATNRALLPGGLFGDTLSLVPGLTYGTAETGGKTPKVAGLTTATWSPEAVHALLASPSPHLLISIHGFDYHFNDSMERAAFLPEWFAALRPAVIAFAWPSLGKCDPIHYMDDYLTALHAAKDFKEFLAALKPVIDLWRQTRSDATVTLLAHSMGNHFLRHGCEQAGDLAPYAGLLDNLVLAAADADATSINAPGGISLALKLARRAAIYYNIHDLALDVSRDIHTVADGRLNDRIGHLGAPDRSLFAGSNVQFIDTADVRSLILDPEGHQYYRAIPVVRDDICAFMTGGSTVNRVYDPQHYRFLLEEPVKETTGG